MVMHMGRISAEIPREKATQEQLMAHALGSIKNEVAS
jgi:ABC-type sugar transport system ATPase subunit